MQRLHECSEQSSSRTNESCCLLDADAVPVGKSTTECQNKDRWMNFSVKIFIKQHLAHKSSLSLFSPSSSFRSQVHNKIPATLSSSSLTWTLPSSTGRPCSRYASVCACLFSPLSLLVFKSLFKADTHSNPSLLFASIRNRCESLSFSFHSLFNKRHRTFATEKHSEERRAVRNRNPFGIPSRTPCCIATAGAARKKGILSFSLSGL